MLRSRSGTGSKQRLPLLPVRASGCDEDKYYDPKRKRTQTGPNKTIVFILTFVTSLFLLKRMIFPLSHDSVMWVDDTVRNMWLRAEQSGLIERFPEYKTDYDQDFPFLSLLEENYAAIRQEAVQLLDETRDHIPRLKDLVGTKRSASKVYTTDWKTYWLKMGWFIPENCARAPVTTELLKQIPDVTNAFFSVLEPHQHIDGTSSQNYQPVFGIL